MFDLNYLSFKKIFSILLILLLFFTVSCVYAIDDNSSDIDEFSDSNQNSDFVEELDSSDEKISLLACENLNY